MVILSARRAGVVLAVLAGTLGPALAISPGERVASATGLIPSAPSNPAIATIEDAIKARLQDERSFAIDKKVRAALTSYYEAHGFGSIWIDGGAWTPRARQILDRMGKARYDGLDPSDYARASFDTVSADASPEALAKAELDLSVAVLTYARHAVGGRADIQRLAPNVYAKRPDMDLAGLLTSLVALPDPVALLDGLHPTHPGFLALKRELARLLDTPVDREQPAVVRQPIPGGPVVRLGMADPRVLTLRERFALQAASGQASDVLDGALVAALRRFQETRGLQATGALTPQTVRALNGDLRPASQDASRLADVVVNMERWRWLPRDLGQHYVMVSVPEFLVRVMDNDQVAYEGKVVVGTEKTPTPLFSATMEYLVVNPSWTVPPGILRKEILPLYRSNPAAVARLGLQVIHTRYGVSFRQAPSERNALGRIKFMFPNDYSIYLHDTPAKGYFQREKRAFSHGCVRVDTPLRFADALLSAETNLNSRRIESLYGAGERYVKMMHRVPVHLTYFTAEVRPDGSFVHHDDVYGLDTKMKQLMGL